MLFGGKQEEQSIEVTYRENRRVQEKGVEKEEEKKKEEKELGQ